MASLRGRWRSTFQLPFSLVCYTYGQGSSRRWCPFLLWALSLPILHPIALQWSEPTKRGLIQQKKQKQKDPVQALYQLRCRWVRTGEGPSWNSSKLGIKYLGSHDHGRFTGKRLQNTGAYNWNGLYLYLYLYFNHQTGRTQWQVNLSEVVSPWSEHVVITGSVYSLFNCHISKHWWMKR